MNGSWTGIIGHIVNGVRYRKLSKGINTLKTLMQNRIGKQTSHFGICVISHTNARQEYVDFTRYIYLNSITFMSHSPGLMQREWLITSPFSTVTWILIILFLDGLTLLLTLMYRHWHFNVFITVHRDLFGILLNQNIIRDYKEFQCSATRLVLAFWILGALILSNAYSSSFYSILVVPVFGSPIDSIDDLIKVVQSDSKFIAMNGRSIYWYDLVNAKADNYVYYTLGEHLNR